MDALAHAIEAYVSNIAQLPADALALKAIETIGAELRIAVANGNHLKARSEMSLGSLMAGMAFNNAFLGLTHSIGAALSGYAHVSHGMAIALLLPYVMEYNSIACQEKYRAIAIALGEKVDNLTLREASLSAASAVHALVEDVGLPNKLSQLGLKENVLPEMARTALTHGMVKMNPRIPTEDDILNILRRAF